ncbi:conserved hypothetical protein [Vibrio chagasii]|nr:conserved hypothetical protein [Vibrio chagasii]
MAKIYSHPRHIEFPKPDYRNYNRAEEDKKLAKFLEELRNFCKTERPKCPDAGKIIRFQVADGYAQYMIYDYRTIIHIPEGDAYSIPCAHARGLLKADLVSLVKSEEAKAKLFRTMQP